MRLLAFADVHLKPDRLADQAQVLERIADLAEERDVDAVLFAGDLFEGPLVTPEEYVAAQKAFLRFAPRPVIACRGNGRHDLATRQVSAIEVLGGWVTAHASPSIVSCGSAFATPGRFDVACLPWTPVGPLVARHGGGDRDHIHEHAADLLIEIARGLRADILQGVPAILLLHWSISGASLPNGLAVNEHAREPILPLHELEALGFDAVIAGHIHKPQLLSMGAQVTGNGSTTSPCPVLYCGSPLPLNFGEADTRHGVWILDVDAGGVRPEFVEIPSRPWVTLDASDEIVDVGALEDFAATATVADAYVRFRYRCNEEQARYIDRHALEQALYDAGAYRVVSITPDLVRAERARADAAIEDLSPVETVRLWVTAQEFKDARADEIVAAAAPYLETA